MPYFESIKNLTNAQKLMLLNQLVQMAKADNSFKFIEFKYLTDVAELMGISTSQLEAVLEGKLVAGPLPKRKIEKAWHLYRLAVMMMIDHDINMEEIKFLKKIAHSFNLSSKSVDAMLRAMHTNKGGMLFYEDLKRIFAKENTAD